MNSLDQAQQLAVLIKQLGGIDRAEVDKIVAEAVAKGIADATPRIVENARKGIVPQTNTIVINPNGTKHTFTKRVHSSFKLVMDVLSAGLHPLLIGPSGCGKSYLTEQLAEAGNDEYGVIHGTAGASESHLQGWLLPIGTGGGFQYVPAEFVRLWEQGKSLFTFDELDAFDPNMLIVVNGALASGVLHIPQRYQAPHVKKGDGAKIVATANTFGTGGDVLYAGRNQLDATTLDRFYPIVMDYDKDLETDLCPNETIRNWAWRLREMVNTLKLRRIVSTRTIIKANAMVSRGYQFEEIKKQLLTGWTRDELGKVGELKVNP